MPWRSCFFKHVRFVVCIVCVWILFIALHIPCPIQYFLDVPCPTCGVSRALIALLHGDIQEYYEMQPMALPLVLTVVVCMHLSKMPTKIKRFAVIFATIVLALNTILYVAKVVEL